jgi:hypothetical protein
MANDVFYSAKHWAAKAEKSAVTAERYAQSQGKITQIGYDGTLEEGMITFKHAPNNIEVPYNLFDDYEYELDLSLPITEELPKETRIVVKNGDDFVTFVAATHRDSTTQITVEEMSSVMRYNDDTGYRWLFKAVYKVTPSGQKVFLLYPVITPKTASHIVVSDLPAEPEEDVFYYIPEI